MLCFDFTRNKRRPRFPKTKYRKNYEIIVVFNLKAAAGFPPLLTLHADEGTNIIAEGRKTKKKMESRKIVYGIEQ